MRLNSFNKTVIAILGGLLLMIGVVIWRGDRVGAQITVTIPPDGGTIGSWGKIGVEFKQPMQTKSIETRIALEPDVPGHTQWEGNTLWYIPQRPLSPDTQYRFTVKSGGLAQDNRPMLRNLSVNFHIRQPDVIYLATNNNQFDLWSIPLVGGKARQLTSTGGKVFDFAASHDGAQIAYTVNNVQGGIDLWLVQRDGSHPRLLENCGKDRCIEPAWSPDSKEIVYLKDVLNTVNVTSPTGIWVIDPTSGQTDYLFPGTDTSWSPDGTYLAILDANSGFIRVLNVETGKGIQITAQADIPPQWYPDGARMIYADLQTASGMPFVILSEVDLSTNHVSRFLSNDADKVEYGIPAVSPDGQSLVMSLRFLSGGLTKQLWYMGIDGSHKKAITSDEEYYSAHYSWDPQGGAVLFQRVKLGDSQSDPEVMVWDRTTAQTRMLVSDGALPSWLP